MNDINIFVYKQNQGMVEQFTLHRNGTHNGPHGWDEADGYFEGEMGMADGADVCTRCTRFGFTCAFSVPRATRTVDALRLLPTCCWKGTMDLR